MRYLFRFLPKCHICWPWNPHSNLLHIAHKVHLTRVSDRRFKDQDGVIGEEVGDDEPAVHVNGLGGVHTSQEAQYIAVQAMAILLHELDEVSPRGLGEKAHAGAQRVFLTAKTIVGWGLSLGLGQLRGIQADGIHISCWGVGVGKGHCERTEQEVHKLLRCWLIMLTLNAFKQLLTLNSVTSTSKNEKEVKKTLK